MTPHAERPGDDPKRETPATQPDQQSLLDQLRDANEQLVVSSMQNQTLADAADRARADAETANRLKDEFLAMVSHELRTPLSALLGCAHLLDRGQLDPAQAMHAIHVIERNARAAARIIDDLLDVSRIIGGSIRLDRQPVDLSAVVQEALDALRLAADARAINVIFIDHAVPEPVAGDSLRLTQVVENLLSNAVKFTPRGGRIEVRLTSAGSQVEIQVADTGQGIAPEFLPHLFERFSQAKMVSTRQGGIGLGLAIVKALVEGHGGSVHAHSPGVGEGATFTVRLPVLSPRELDQLERVGGADTPAAAPARLDNIKVLLVEDDADARDVLRLILEMAGAKVEASGSVRGALRALDDFRPDVLVSDIGMPDEDGYTLIRHVRAREGNGGYLPAIALTGYVTSEDSARLRAAGFQMHARKPVEPDELVAMVASLARSGSR
ncbi:MAG TPA: ATP-binding protein [Methylomirabilota bacterium]|nr:ATP-binding protein [Methylomirabilota bacterium]